MSKIDFSKLPCYTDIRKAEKRELDIRFQLSNTMYMQGSGIAMGALAMKIYNSKGEEEYTDEECKIILNFVKSGSPILYDSINDIINNK